MIQNLNDLRVGQAALRLDTGLLLIDVTSSTTRRERIEMQTWGESGYSYGGPQFEPTIEIEGRMTEMMIVEQVTGTITVPEVEEESTKRLVIFDD